MDRRSFVRGSAAAGLGLAAGSRWAIGWDTPRAAAQATPVAVSTSALADLRNRLHGTLLLPEDSGYPSAVATANQRYAAVQPLAVARCADEADVVTSVRWCTEQGVLPTVRGGGHSYAGFSTTTGLLIDLRRLNTVQVDRGAGVMTIGGAALNADLFVALENGPHILPGGICPGVGVGGLTLGGGLGYNSRWAGLTSDHLQESRIVAASGDVLDIASGSHPDLYWACRGGAGGSFGVNTAFTFSLVEVPTSLATWFSLSWRGADAAEGVLAAFDQILQTAPDAFSGLILAEPLEIGADGPRAAISVWTTGRYLGPAAELRDLLQPLLAAAEPSDQRIEEMSFWQVQRQLAEPDGSPHAFADTSRYAREALPATAIANIVDLLTRCPVRTAEIYGAFLTFGWVGGAVDAVARTDTAYVHRGMTALHRSGVAWPMTAPKAVRDEMLAWNADVVAAIVPYTPEESYQNFPNRDLEHWQQLYYAENFPRLVEVKRRYDPGNLFRTAQSIPTHETG